MPLAVCPRCGSDNVDVASADRKVAAVDELQPNLLICTETGEEPPEDSGRHMPALSVYTEMIALVCRRCECSWRA